MAENIEELVARIPDSVIAIDHDLRIVAASPQAREHLDLPTEGSLGQRCCDVMSLADKPTGLPCRQRCPFASAQETREWAHSRAVHMAQPDGSTIPIDCLLLTHTTPQGPPSRLCFLQRSLAPALETHVPVLRAIEAVYPAIAGTADPKDALSSSLKSVLDTTFADGGELFLSEPGSEELVLQECQGLDKRTMNAFRRTALGDRFLSSLLRLQLPLLATGPWPGSKSNGASGLYMCAPIVAEGRVLGALAIASKQPDFNVATAARILFAVSAQLGLYLRWANHAGQARRKGRRSTHQSKAPRLRIYCLGPFRVVVDGQAVPASRFQRLKALKLLKCLAANIGSPVSRETLMEFLWPEADPARSSGNLRVVLHALRRALEPGLARGEASSFVVAHGGQVCLKPSNQVWVDAEEFFLRARRASNLVSQGRIETAITECRRAASLYRGEYLEDEPYGEWCVFERDRLRERYISLMTRMASMLAATGDHNCAIETYRTTLGVDRGREEVHRELMLLLLKAGRRDEALRQYDACRNSLREELAVEPTQETVALRQALLAGDHQ